MKNKAYGFFSFLTQLCHQSLLMGGCMVLFAGFSAHALDHSLDIDSTNATMARPLMGTAIDTQDLGGLASNIYPPTSAQPELSDDRTNNLKVLKDGDIPCCCCPKKSIIRKRWAITGLAGIALIGGGVSLFLIRSLIPSGS